MLWPYGDLKVSADDLSCFQTLRSDIVFIILINVANSCWHVNIYELDKFHAQLS